MTRARSVRGSYRDRLRAAIVLAAAAGQANAAIARELGVCTDTARKWRRRFAEGRLAGLTDAPRSGRPPVFTAADRAEVVAVACALPAESGVPLSRWSGPDLAREVAVRCQLAVSASTIRRWLAGDALKPWQHRSWISVRDPQFAARAAPVLDLYAGTWDGRPLGPDDYVICAGAAATPPCHPGKPARYGWSTTTTAAARWPTWPPGTCTADGSPAGARTPPGSLRSPGWRSR